MTKMNFDKKLINFFKGFNLTLKEKYPFHLIHLYADYVELVALFSNQDFVTSSDIIERFRNDGIFDKEEKDELRAKQNDDYETFINAIFKEIEGRSILMSNAYPFNYNKHNSIRCLKDITNKHKLYLFLLLSSNLSYFMSFKPELTSEFEFVSYNALKSYLPSNTKVEQFGDNSRFKGNIINKITDLAKELNIEIDDNFVNKISPRGNKERGLDLIGWLPFADLVPNNITVLCQCACGKDWEKKLHETRRYERYFRFYLQVPIHAMFLPYALLNFQSGSFNQADEFSVNTLIFERSRIVSTITDCDFFGDLESSKLIEKCIEFTEDIV